MAGARNTPYNERLEQRAAHDVLDIPTTKKQRAQLIGECTVGTRARSGNAIGAERVARGADQAAAGARARSAHAIGAEHVARGGDGSQRLPRPAHKRAARSAPSAERRAQSAEREAAIRLAAGARARSARAIGARITIVYT